MPSLAEWITLSVCAVAAFTDWRRTTIPNWLTFPVLILAPIYAAVLEFPWGLIRSLLGMVLCGLVPLLLFYKRAVGGGDVKLLAAVGALCGYMIGIEIQLFAFIIAAIYALLALTWKGLLWRTLSNTFFLSFNVFLPKEKRRTIEPQLLSSLRFGLPIFSAAGLSIALRSISLWG
ncbi:MAG: prepilin peptidase [Myxococcales bacterium]|nr:MAG: prepilin peptidase [Myxococcales bacterium]